SMEQNDMEAARAAYQKAIDIDPNYINAYLNLSTAYVNEGNGLIEQMNSIRGSSAKEIAKYDALKEQKDGFFKKGADVLEAALKVNVGNRDLMEQLKNIYGALGDFVNFKRLQEALEQ
ncbi:MAG: tetratricopeptide repeat protein, partial [Flavobacteriaceae bacterium]